MQGPDFLGNPAAAGLYYLAGSWLMSQIYTRRGDGAIPSDWFVPDWWVASIPRGGRLAAYLAARRPAATSSACPVASITPINAPAKYS